MPETEGNERERQTRKRRIDPKLAAQGWTAVPPAKPLTLLPAAIEEYQTVSRDRRVRPIVPSIL